MIRPLHRPLPTQHTTNRRDKLPCHSIRWIRNPSSRNQASADLCLRPHGHRDQNRKNGGSLNFTLNLHILNYFIIHTYIKKSPYLGPCVAWSQSLSAGFVWSCSEWRHYHNLADRLPPYVAFRQAETALCVWVGIVTYFGPDTAFINWSVSWFSSIPPITYPGSASRCQAIPFSSIFADHPAISFYINKATA